MSEGDSVVPCVDLEKADCNTETGKPNTRESKEAREMEQSNTNPLGMENVSAIVPEMVQPSQVTDPDSSTLQGSMSSLRRELEELELTRQYAESGTEHLHFPLATHCDPKMSDTVPWYPDEPQAPQVPLEKDIEKQSNTDGTAVQNIDAQNIQGRPIETWITGNNSVSASPTLQWYSWADSNAGETSQNFLLHTQAEGEPGTAPQYVQLGQQPGSNTETAPPNVHTNPYMETYSGTSPQDSLTYTQMGENTVTPVQNFQMCQTEVHTGAASQYFEKHLQTETCFGTGYQNLQPFPRTEGNNGTAPRNLQGHSQTETRTGTTTPYFQTRLLPHINFDDEFSTASQEKSPWFSGTTSKSQSMHQQPAASPGLSSQTAQFPTMTETQKPLNASQTSMHETNHPPFSYQQDTVTRGTGSTSGTFKTDPSKNTNFSSVHTAGKERSSSAVSENGNSQETVSTSSPFKIPAIPRRRSTRKARQVTEVTRPGTPFSPQSVKSSVDPKTRKGISNLSSEKWPETSSPTSRRRAPPRPARQQRATSRRTTAKSPRAAKSKQLSESESSAEVVAHNEPVPEVEQEPSISRRVPENVQMQVLQTPLLPQKTGHDSASESELYIQNSRAGIQPYSEQSNVLRPAMQQQPETACSLPRPQTPYPETESSALCAKRNVEEPSSGYSDAILGQNLPMYSATGRTSYYASSAPVQPSSASTWLSHNRWSSLDMSPSGLNQSSAEPLERKGCKRASDSPDSNTSPRKKKCSDRPYPEEMLQESTISTSNTFASQNVQSYFTEFQTELSRDPLIEQERNVLHHRITDDTFLKTMPMCSSSVMFGGSTMTDSIKESVFQQPSILTYNETTSENFQLCRNTNPMRMQQGTTQFSPLVSQGLQPRSLVRPSSSSLQMHLTSVGDGVQNSCGVLPPTSSSLLLLRTTLTQQQAKIPAHSFTTPSHRLQVYSSATKHSGCKYVPFLASQRCLSVCLLTIITRVSTPAYPEYAQISSLNLPVSKNRPTMFGGKIITPSNPPSSYTQQGQDHFPRQLAHPKMFGRTTLKPSNLPPPYSLQGQRRTSTYPTISGAGHTVFGESALVPSKPPPPYPQGQRSTPLTPSVSEARPTVFSEAMLAPSKQPPPYPQQRQGWTSKNQSVSELRPSLFGGTMFTPSKPPPPYPQQDQGWTTTDPPVSVGGPTMFGGKMFTPLKPPPPYPQQCSGWASTNVPVSKAHSILFGGTALASSNPAPPYPHQDQGWKSVNPPKSEARTVKISATPLISQPRPYPEKAQGWTPMDLPESEAHNTMFGGMTTTPLNPAAPYTQHLGRTLANPPESETLQMDYEPRSEFESTPSSLLAPSLEDPFKME